MTGDERGPAEGDSDGAGTNAPTNLQRPSSQPADASATPPRRPSQRANASATPPLPPSAPADPDAAADPNAAPQLGPTDPVTRGLEAVRAAQDARRQANSVLRDVVAAERDRVAERRDRVASSADEALLAAHPENAELEATVVAHALVREQFSAERSDAARDRAGAAEDRMQAAIDRHEARVDRDRLADAAPTDANSTPPHGSHPEMASGRIAKRLIGLHKEYRGRGPQRVDVQCLENMVTVVMRDDYSPLERHLSAAGHAKSVDDQRSVYEELMKPLLVEATEQELARTVDAFLSVSHHDPDMTVEIFVLAPR